MKLNELIPVKLLSKDAKIPDQAYEHDAGFDLYSTFDKMFSSCETSGMNIHVCIEIPIGYVGMICTRSSDAKSGLFVVGGIIDSGYRGEIIVLLHYSGNGSIHIRKGDKIAQLLIVKLLTRDEAFNIDLKGRIKNEFEEIHESIKTRAKRLEKNDENKFKKYIYNKIETDNLLKKFSIKDLQEIADLRFAEKTKLQEEIKSLKMKLGGVGLGLTGTRLTTRQERRIEKDLKDKEILLNKIYSIESMESGEEISKLQNDRLKRREKKLEKERGTRGFGSSNK